MTRRRLNEAAAEAQLVPMTGPGCAGCGGAGTVRRRASVGDAGTTFSLCPKCDRAFEWGHYETIGRVDRAVRSQIGGQS